MGEKLSYNKKQLIELYKHLTSKNNILVIVAVVIYLRTTKALYLVLLLHHKTKFTLLPYCNYVITFAIE